MECNGEEDAGMIIAEKTINEEEEAGLIDTDETITEEEGAGLIIADETTTEEEETGLFIIKDNNRIKWIIGLTLFFESVTSFLRFGLGKESTKDTSSISRFTFGLRIHHGYIGLVMATLLARRMPLGSPRRIWCIRIGIALVASDLIHHFLVLWPITGNPHFDLV